MCSSIKPIPQLLWNYSRKTTKGWSILNVILDLTGGIFSVLETTLRLALSSDYSLNIIKLLLGILTMIYNILFIHQHYCLYPIAAAPSQPE